MSIVGTRVVRTEDHKLITAGGGYVDDLREPELSGAAHAMFVRSPMAHARIESIDKAAAAESPGVLAVITGADLDLAPHKVGSVVEPWLATDVVRYVGQPVALVVTEQRYQLADAAELLDVDYEPLDAVIDVDDALRGDTLLFPELGTNIVDEQGEFDDATFDGCEVVVTQRVRNQRLAPAPMEGRGASCAWGDDGRLSVWLSTQNAQISRDVIAGGLGIDPAEVRVVAPDVGGGFGAKIGADPEPVVLGWASRLVGLPLRWTETRSENLTSMTHGRAQQHTITIGGSRDGTVQAYRLDVVQDAGAYPRMVPLLPSLTRLMATGVYRIPRVEARSRGIVTTTTPIGAYRGAGRPEATAAIERAIDLFAAEIGMDPAEVRRRNLIPSEQFPYTTPTGASYDTGEYVAALDRVLETGDYQALRAEQARRRDAGDVVALGLGLASYVEITAGDAPAGESGKVVVHEDGSVTAYTGSSAHGQGHDTSFAMVLSDQLGVPMDKIIVRHGDSDEIPKAVGTFGSRSLQLGGSAVYQAGEKVIERARELAAELLEAAVDDVELNADAGMLQVKGVPESTVSWGQVAQRAGEEGLSADVWFGDGQPTFPFGAHLAVVEVDTGTGKVVLRRILALDDAGPVVNPLAFQGQRHGGLAQGAAQALLEEMSYDPDGNPMTATFADYGFITAAELPDFELMNMETPTTRNPLGVKGIGEAATIGSTPAVQNAVVDALAPLGVRHIDMPATPQRVWQAIQEAKSA